LEDLELVLVDYNKSIPQEPQLGEILKSNSKTAQSGNQFGKAKEKGKEYEEELEDLTWGNGYAKFMRSLRIIEWLDEDCFDISSIISSLSFQSHITK